jgi:hypothetical protein
LKVRNAVAVGDDDFADVARLLHVPKCVDDIRGFEGLVGQRAQHAILEQREHFGEQAARQVGSVGHQLVGIDAEVADVVAEWPQADARIFVKVALAEFEEAAKRLEHAEVAIDRFAGERVQHDVDAGAAGRREDFVGEREAARIEDAIDAEQRRKLRFSSEPAVA